MNIMRTLAEMREESMRQDRLSHFQSAALCALVNGFGAQYGIRPVEGQYWYFEERARRYKYFCRLEGNLIGFGVHLFPECLVSKPDLVNRIVRCLAEEPGCATGDEYAEVAGYFEKKQYVEGDDFLAEELYQRAIAAGFQPAVGKLFVKRCGHPWYKKDEKYLNWDAIYRYYQSALEQGLNDADLEAVDPAIVHAVRVEQKAEQGDLEAIREIARHYLFHCSVKSSGAWYIHLLAEKGDVEGIVLKSRYLFEKRGNLKKKADGMVWHLKAAELGDAESMYRAGRIYELMAHETPAYWHHAIRYHEMAAQKGILESMHRLSLLYAQPLTDTYNPQKSAFYTAKCLEFAYPS